MSLKLMAIEQSDRVDIISIDPSTGNVVLTVNVHLKDSLAHQALLQRKLNYYFAFVNSGELLEIYRHAEGKPVVFRVVFVTLYRRIDDLTVSVAEQIANGFPRLQ